MKLFRILFAFDAFALLVLAYFFLDGLRYEPSGDYFSAWVPLLLGPAAVMLAAWALRGKGRTTSANVLLTLLALPFFCYLLFVGLFVVLQPDMR